MGTWVSALLFLVTMCGTSLDLAAREFYVAPTGSDVSGGGTEASPYREIRTAIKLVSPGDIIYVASGEYLGFDVLFKGNTSAPIAVRATGTNVVILPVPEKLQSSESVDTITFWGSTNIVLDGIRSFNSGRIAIRIAYSPYITIRNCVFGHHPEEGILTTFSDYTTIENCVIYDCYGSIAHGTYIANSSSWPTLRGNIIYNIYGAAMHCNGDISQGPAVEFPGTRYDGLIRGALYENNVIFGSCAGGGAAIHCDGMVDSVIRNNLIVSNSNDGIKCFVMYGASGPRNIEVYNNTLDNYSSETYGVIRFADSVGTNYIRNNIVYQRATGIVVRTSISWKNVSEDQYIDSDYSIFGRDATFRDGDSGQTVSLADRQAAGQELHSFIADDTNIWMDAAGADYRLWTNSVAREAGLLITNLLEDIIGQPRPFGPGIDIGCYEFTDGPPPDTDGDGMPDYWEIRYGFNRYDPGDAGEDRDGDRLRNLDEYIAGTVPTDWSSKLSFSFIRGQGNTSLRNLSFDPETGYLTQLEIPVVDRMVMRWNVVSGRRYTIYRSTNMLETFTPVSSNLASFGFYLSYTDRLDTASTRFYKLGADWPR